MACEITLIYFVVKRVHLHLYSGKMTELVCSFCTSLNWWELLFNLLLCFLRTLTYFMSLGLLRQRCQCSNCFGTYRLKGPLKQIIHPGHGEPTEVLFSLWVTFLSSKLNLRPELSFPQTLFSLASVSQDRLRYIHVNTSQQFGIWDNSDVVSDFVGLITIQCQGWVWN